MPACRGDPARAPTAGGRSPAPTPTRDKKKAPDPCGARSGAANKTLAAMVSISIAASVAQRATSTQDRTDKTGQTDRTAGRSGARPRGRQRPGCTTAAPVITGAILLPVPSPSSITLEQDQEYHCPGCGAHPDPCCSVCGQPTAYALLTDPYGCGPDSARREHCMTFCAGCHTLLLQLRAQAASDPRSRTTAAPLRYVPLDGHQKRSNAPRGRGSTPSPSGVSSDVRTPARPVALQQTQLWQERAG